MKLFRQSVVSSGGWILIFVLLLGMTAVSCSRSATGAGKRGQGGVPAPDQTWANQPGADLLWTVDQLKAAIANGEDIVLVDCRYLVAAFDLGHIPTAIWIDWHEMANDPPIDFPPLADVETFLGQDRGIKVNSKIVLYGDGLNDLEAPFRLFWMLEYYGCRDVHIVDGGFAAWNASAFPIDNTPWDPNAIVPETFSSFIDNLGLADATDVHVFLADPATSGSVLIDVRTPAEFSGEFTSELQDRAGRIPHAGHFNWIETIDPVSGRLADVQSVIDRFKNGGYNTQKELIAYSTTGVRSTVPYFLSRVLGYNCRVYQGGMTQWTDVDNPPLVCLGMVERSGPFFHRSIIDGDERPHYAGDAVVFDGQIFVIGGFRWDKTEQRLRLTKGIWRFDPTVSPVHEGSDATSWTLTKCHTGMPVYALSAVSVPGANAIYLFGGIDSVGKVYDMILRVDIDPVTYNTTEVTKLPETLSEPLAFANAVFNEADGLIYIFGGQTGLTASTASSAAYAYAPGAPPVPVASLPSARTRHGSAVVNGKVYCLGGEEADTTILDEVLEYDPALDAWSVLDPMSIPRLRAEGAVVFGRIYVCGGFSRDSAKGYVTSDHVESLDPSDPVAGWRDEGNMAAGRYCNPVAAVNNRIYLLGAYAGLTQPLKNEAEILNVTEFRPAHQALKADMPSSQHGGATAEVHGKIYLIGGRENTALTDRVLEYCPVADTYTVMDPFPGGPVKEACAVSTGGVAYVFGGKTAGGASAGTYWFDPAQPAGSQWGQLADMPTALYGAAAALYNDANDNLGYGAGHNLVFVIGGKDLYDLKSAVTFVYDATGDIWDVAYFLLPSKRSHAAAVVCVDDIFLTGGVDAQGIPLADTLMLGLDPMMPGFLEWGERGAMPTARYGHGAAMIGNRFYNIGGFVKVNGKFNGTDAVEVFEADKGRWTVLEGLDERRALPFVSGAPTASGTSLFVMGGYTGTSGGTYFNDTVELAP